MRSLGKFGTPVAAAIVAGGVTAAIAIELPAVVPVSIAVAGLLWALARWPQTSRIAELTGTVATVSLAITAFYPHLAHPRAHLAGLLGSIEALAISALVALTARKAPARPAAAACALAFLAAALWDLRFPSVSAASTVGGGAFWSLLTTAALFGGLFLRSLDAARLRAVLEARRQQRLELARDLHDFVAHDISEIVVQAQTARFVGEQQTPDALVTIEEAGIRALASMDRTLQVLRGAEEPRTPVPGLADLPELADRFSASGATKVHLVLDPALTDAVGRDVDSTAYRLVLEALTNVRRHAPGAARVDVHAGVEGARVRVTITNEPGPPARRIDRRSSGFGLAGLKERVESVGGTLTAGPCDAGWRVSASLPLGSAP